MSPAPVNQLDFIQQQLDEIRDSFKFVWTEYLKWYTFLSTLNLLALGFVHGSATTPNRPSIVLAFATFNFLGCITSIALFEYTRRNRRRWSDGKAIIRSGLTGSGASGDVVETLTLPFAIGMWAAVANGIALLLFLVIWIRMWS